MKIIYPKHLKPGDRIGVIAPSSGVPSELHGYLKKAGANLEQKGFQIQYGDSVWEHFPPAELRRKELQQMLLDETIDAIIPPWGGEFLMEILPSLDFEQLAAHPKWMLGYSDISTFLFPYTLHTGIATAHGPNFYLFCADQLDDTTNAWLDVLKTERGASVRQKSSVLHQSSWAENFKDPLGGLRLDTPTEWKSLFQKEGKVTLGGRLLGGCMDTVSVLVGTRFAPVESFVRNFCPEGVLWYLESCEMNAAEIYRRLWQMKECGWFAKANGVLIGRPAGYSPTQGFELEDALRCVFEDLQIPVVYNTDIGHVNPLITLVNGALAKVQVEQGQATVEMTFA